MAKKVSSDTRRRIQKHIVNLGDEDMPIALKAQRRLLRFGRKALEPLLEALSSENPQMRWQAVYLIAKTGEPEMLPIIARFVDDPDDTVRYDAVMALGYLGTPQAIPLLRELANRRDDPVNVASAAIGALAMFGVFTESDGT